MKKFVFMATLLLSMIVRGASCDELPEGIRKAIDDANVILRIKKEKVTRVDSKEIIRRQYRNVVQFTIEGDIIEIVKGRNLLSGTPSKYRHEYKFAEKSRTSTGIIAKENSALRQNDSEEDIVLVREWKEDDGIFTPMSEVIILQIDKYSGIIQYLTQRE